jgi:hypothetical protein
MEQMLRLLHSCGLPVEDVDFINCDGKTMNKLLLEVGFFIPYFFPHTNVCIVEHILFLKDDQFTL